MAWFHPDAVEERRRRFMRPDAERWLKPDPERWLSPEELRLEYPELYERKYGGADRSLVSKRDVINPLDDPEVRLLLAEIKLDLVRWQFWRKANFNPNQPRYPKSTPHGGRWRRVGGGPPVEPLPRIPERRQPTREKIVLIKQIAKWLAVAIRESAPVRAFMVAYQAASLLDTDRPFADAYLDPPRTMEELQERALNRQWGYNIHHVVEKTSAAEDGFSQEMIEARENRVLVPALKHWEITGWYMRPNRDYGDLSPREYLRGRSWEERLEVGRRALILHGVLRP